MAQHPNEKLLVELYNKFSQGDLAGVLAMCAADMQFTVPGKAPFSGVYTKETFPGMVGEVMRICNGSFREVPVHIIASDDHGVAILDHFIERDGKSIQYRTDHIWTIRDGQFTSWVERPGNQEEFDRVWAEKA